MADPESDGPPFGETLRTRAPLLAALADGPLTQRALRETLDVSRSTVYKAVQDLLSAGLVTEADDGYRLTRMGRLAWRRHDAYLARLTRLEGADRLLETVPHDVHLPLALVEHGRIHAPGRHAPERPLDRLETLAEDADRLRVLSPAGMPRYVADIHERVSAGRQTATLVLEPPAVDRIATEYDRWPDATDASGFDVRVVDAALPFALVLFDEATLGFFAYEDGVLVGAIFATDDAVRRWGERVYDRYHAASTAVED